MRQRWAGEKKGWGVEIEVGDIVECAALPVKNYGYFIVIEKHAATSWGDYARVLVVHAVSKRPLNNSPLNRVYHFRKVDVVTALATLSDKREGGSSE